MVPGTRTTYEAHTPDGLQQTTTEVTRDTKTIMGVKTVVVHDTVSLDAKMVEDTLDWSAAFSWLPCIEGTMGSG